MNSRAIAFFSRSCGFAFLILTVFSASSRPQTPNTQTVPEVSLSVNQEFEPVSSQGWPLVFDLEVYHPSVGQANGNLSPISLSLPTGSWSDAVHLIVRDGSGNPQTWPASLVFRPTGSQSSITLDAEIEGRLAWAVPPSSTGSIPAGTYEAVAILDASSSTEQGAFNGIVASNPVTITIQSEPSPLPPTLQEQKYTLLAAYDLLQGNSTQATADINTIITIQPNNSVGIMYMGDLQELQGQPLAALQSYDQAVSTFATANPVASEPPTWLIDRQASIRAGLISQAGTVGIPQVTVTLLDQGLQSAGVYFLDLQITNNGSGVAELTSPTQFSYLTVSGTGQVTYDTTLSPKVPFGAYSLAPNASTTARIYVDVPATVTQFSLSLSVETQDSVGTEYTFSGTQTISVNSAGGGGPGPLTITTANATQQYGQPTPNLNSVTYAGFVNGDTPASLGGILNCVTTATSASPVGSYPITCSGQTSPNYVITYVPGTLTITAAPLTLTANNVTRIYGAANPPLNSLTASGFVNGDSIGSLVGTLSCTTAATQANPVGPYAITCSGLASSNYTITFVPGLLTIEPAPLTITANNASRQYGVANPPLNGVTASGFVNGDTLTSLSGTLVCSSSAASTSPEGAYAIICLGLSSPNYSITFLPGTLTVISDVLTVTASNATRLYGQPNPPLNNVTYAGFVNGDTAASLAGALTCTTPATAASPVGSYPINCSGLSSPNYVITLLPGVLTVTPVPLTLTANNESKVYSAAMPNLTFSAFGFVNGDTLANLTTQPTLSTTATTASGVGSYPISISGAVDSNYSITYSQGTLTVTAVVATITANSVVKVLDAVNPTFAWTVTGFVNGDTASVLTTKPTCATSATAASPVGSYTITCSGAAAANYTFMYVAGAFEIQYATTIGHTIQPPINADGTSIFNQGRTVPAKFAVYDANGVSIGTPGVVAKFLLTRIASGTTTTNVENVVDTNNPDTAFRWDPTGHEWIFNITTANLLAGNTYIFTITLNDGSTITFQFGLR